MKKKQDDDDDDDNDETNVENTFPVCRMCSLFAVFVVYNIITNRKCFVSLCYIEVNVFVYVHKCAIVNVLVDVCVGVRYNHKHLSMSKCV